MTFQQHTHYANLTSKLSYISYICKMIQKSIHIKNMVCPRCITAVEQTLHKLNIPFTEVKLGEALVNTDTIDYTTLNKELKVIGFELIKDKKQILVEQIKTLIVDLIHHNNGNNIVSNFSEYLSKNIGYDYAYISNIFSKEEDTTIEKFMIIQKIERVKELIKYNELNFSEIAFRLNYSSASHLSKQFKKITGLTLSEYKRSNNTERKTIDKLL